MDSYYDVTLDERVQQVRTQLEGDLGQVWQQVVGRYADDIEGLRQQYAQLQADFAGRMERYSLHLQDTWHSIKSELDLSVPHLGYYALPEPAIADELGDGLYNTEREYLEQIEAYKLFQGKLVMS